MGKKIEKNSLGTRMKGYEAVTDIQLITRMPVMIRLDGAHFHTFTSKLKRPFDDILIKTMQYTMLALCKDIPGAVFGYTQSDEITLVLVDYNTLDTQPWYKNRLEKICSMSASKASRYFNKFYRLNVEAYFSTFEVSANAPTYDSYAHNFDEADFDCRVWNLTKEEVCNNIVWRQTDAERNSVLMLAQSLYTHKELHGLSVNRVQDKMFTEKGVNWNNLCTPKKRGSACYKDKRVGWVIDENMPIVKNDRQYVERFVTNE